MIPTFTNCKLAETSSQQSADSQNRLKDTLKRSAQKIILKINNLENHAPRVSYFKRCLLHTNSAQFRDLPESGWFERKKINKSQIET